MDAQESNRDIALIFISSLIGIGTLAAGFFGPELLERVPLFAHDPLNYGKVWHVAALVYTAIIILLYHAHVPSTKYPVERSISILINIAALVMLLVSGIYLFRSELTWATFWALSVVVVFALSDGLMALVFHVSETSRDVFAEVFWLADVPLSLASITLIIYLFARQGTEQLDAFYFGATALQLIMSTALFSIIWGRFLPRLKSVHLLPVRSSAREAPNVRDK